MRQRVRRNASRKNGFSATVSARALNVAAFNSWRGFGHHDGTSPHRMRTKSRLPSRSVTTSTGSVGQILYRGGRLCGGALIVSRYSRTISSQVSLFVKRPHIVKTHAHADPTGDDDKLRTQCGRSAKQSGAIELDRSSAVRNHVKTSKCWTARPRLH